MRALANELTQQAQRSLRYAWPKSERLLYAEPKKLVELGLATVEHEAPRLEIEALLRLIFADHGSREDLLAALDEFEGDIGEHHQAIVELMGTDLDGGHPFPE